MLKKMLFIFCLLTGSLIANDKVLTDGHEPGRWTMDFNAAKLYAQQKDLPILLNFTGSDWCGWCKLMEEKVFSKEAWISYAKDNLILVWLDFPKNRALIPEKYVKRNQDLSREYEVKGYPAYIILDSNGKDVLGRLGSGKNKTPVSFKAEVDNLTALRPTIIKKTAEELGEAKGKNYLQAYQGIKMLEEKIKKAEETIRISIKRLEELKKEMEIIRVEAKLSPERRVEYRALCSKVKTCQELINEFLASKPQRTKENMEKWQQLQNNLQQAQNELNEFLD